MSVVDVFLSVADSASTEAIRAALARAGGPRRKLWRPRARVWLSGALARPFKFGPVSGLRGWAEAQQAAAAVAPVECGLTGPCVAWVETDPATAPAMATAADVALIDAIERATAEAELRIVSIRPAWALATERAGRELGRDALLAIRDADALTMLGWVDARASFAATYAPAPAEEARGALLQRVQVSVGIADGLVHEVDVSGSGDGPPRLEWRSRL